MTQSSRIMQLTPYFYSQYPSHEYCYDSARNANIAMSAHHITQPAEVTRTVIPPAIPREPDVEFIMPGHDNSLSSAPRADENMAHFSCVPLSDMPGQAPAMSSPVEHVHYATLHSLQDRIYDALRQRLLRLPPEYRLSFLDSVTASVHQDINLGVKPRWKNGEASVMPAFAQTPNETVESEINVSYFTPPDSPPVLSSSVIPTNRGNFRESWQPCGLGDACHAVEWFARPEPSLPRNVGAVSQVSRSPGNNPTFFDVGNSQTSQVHLERPVTDFDDDLLRMPHSITEQVASSCIPNPTWRRANGVNRRQRYAQCDECSKFMLQQSLKRHKKEVHGKMKRPLKKSSFFVHYA